MMRFLIIISMILFYLPIALAQTVVNQDDSIKSCNVAEVVVIGEKPQIKGKNGVISVDLPTIIKNKPVTNIYESLVYLPGVTKELSGNLSLAGTNGITILINGKRPQMSEESVIALLQSYPIGRLKNVEVMYSTPAKYHVDGASINIIMKTPSALDGLQGQMGLDFLQQHYSKGAVNIASTYSADKWSVDFMYNFTAGKDWAHQFIDSYHIFGGTHESVKQNEQSTTNGHSHNGHVGFDWKLCKENNISVSYNFQINPIKYATNFSSGTLGEYTTSKDYPSSNKFNNVNIDYESSFGLTLGMSYTNYKENSNTVLYQRQAGEVLRDYTSSQNIKKYHLHADQSHHVKQWGINYGLLMDYSNDYSSQSFMTSDDADNFNTQLKEYSADAYVGVERNFENGLSFSTSVKVDYYHRNNDTKWWVSPQIALTYMKSPRNIFQIDISTTKNYPSYWEIHGGETWLNNYMMLVGNPMLKPSYTYENQLIYIYHQKYMAVLYYNYTDDYFVQLPYQHPDILKLIYQTQNYNYNQMLGLMVRIPFNIGQTLQSSLTLNGYYTHNKADDFHGIKFDREKFSFYADFTNSVKLLPKSSLYLTVGLTGLTSSLQGITDLSDLWKFDLGLKWTMLNGKADLMFNGTDVFNTWNPQMAIMKYGQNLKMDTYDMTRQFKVSFIYRFNSFKPKTIDIDKSRFGISK